jgi:hypothetical protein
MEMVLKENQYEDVDWIPQDRDHCCAFVDTATNFA